MIAELGHFVLILALIVAVAQSILPAIGVRRDNDALMNFGTNAAKIQGALLLLSFFLLTLVFVASDFSVKLAAGHSHTAKPLLYKITGVWGNHEGSILLWMVMLAGFGAAFAMRSAKLPAKFRAMTLSVQAMIGVGFLSFILFTSNPFDRLNPVPLDGNGLNPLLQDPGLAIHPPLLYLGYVGFSLAFSMSIAALVLGKVDKDWAAWLRPWTLIAWSFLTLGITIGSIWAYYELGWGGWWMWDPVENVSFMPWLIGTALIHSIMVLERRPSLAHWTVLLAITAFSLSLIGTFVVRSGILVSVHAFAVDPERGVVLLALLGIATGGALLLYGLRAKTLFSTSEFDRLSRDGGLVLNNILLATATLTVFLGTFYPVIIDAIRREKISVGAPYFDLTFAPIMSVLIIFMGAAPLLKWNRGALSDMKLLKFVAPALITIGLALYFIKDSLGYLGLALAAYLAIGAVLAMGKRAQWKWALLRQQPMNRWGFFFGHFGVAIFTVGAVTMSVWADDTIGRLKQNESMQVAGYTFTLGQPKGGREQNYEFLRAPVTITKNGREIKTLTTAQRFYPVRNMVTTEAGFHFSPVHTLFVGIGEGTPDNGYIIRANYQPLVTWIWLGAFLMALGGFLSIGRRRVDVS
ncbi:heme lyase CcmF/NrfE family subunit [Litorimonas sp. RW-G-Af-16]|uniref:heme lyase CcmF/NrfE family subunit n=1 Tax=Litorimonas sp. RW-G-Af-16 TaxID=3241168 RepID=UPI00390C58B3